MSEKRYNVFNQIHKGLRGLLYDTALAIQQTDFSQDSAASAIEKVNLVVDLFDEHAHHEDTYLLPIVLKHNAPLVEDFEKDHEIDHKLSESLREQTVAWSKATTKAERIAIGQSLFYAFNEFIAFNLYHMNKEENVLLYTLWQHYTDAELLAVQRTIVESIKPEILMIESKWMMRSLNNTEIIEWLTGIKNGAPAEVYEMYTRLAQQELDTDRWTAVATSLETEMAAA